MADNKAVEIIKERILAKDQLMWSLADTLDVKASIFLVAITFLVGQSAEILTSKEHVSIWITVLQIISIVSSALAGVFIWLALRPRDFDAERSEDFDDWKDSLEYFYRDDRESAEKVETALNNGIIERAQERIENSTIANKRKSGFLFRAYNLTSISLLLNLISIAIKHLS